MNRLICWNGDEPVPNWKRNFIQVNPRTYVPRFTRPIHRACRHSHQCLTSVDPVRRFGVIKYFKLGNHQWVVLTRAMNPKDYP